LLFYEMNSERSKNTHLGLVKLEELRYQNFHLNGTRGPHCVAFCIDAQRCA
jgi:hypothetical protein